MEIVYWKGEAPEGSFAVGSVHISGKATPATLDVFEGSQRLDIQNSEGRQQTVNYMSEPITDPAIATGQLVGTVRRLTPERSAQSAKTAKAKPAAVKSVKRR
jgi:hypothetical protein